MHDLFFSICIPQFNRTSFLKRLLDSVKVQTFRSFEVCISDGCSTDGRIPELEDYLNSLGLSFVLKKSSVNLRYDENLRSSLDLASGKYCILMGNDDEFKDSSVLQTLYELLSTFNSPAVLIGNYFELSSKKMMLRMPQTGQVGSGPVVAAKNFRNYSFVSGVIIRKDLADKFRTNKWDGSEMYQMYLGTAIIASGGTLLGVRDCIINKDIQIPGEEVDSYKKKASKETNEIITRRLPLNQIGLLVCDALKPFTQDSEYNRLGRSVYFQLLVFTYGFWIIEYRRVKSWRYALGICLGMQPRFIFDRKKFSRFTYFYICFLYFCITFFGLLVPIVIFDVLRPVLFKLAKKQ